MGTTRTKPVIRTETVRVEGNGIAVGCCAVQGWRPTMEDAHTIEMDIRQLPGWSWLAIYDGHGGSLVAEESARSLLSYILKSGNWDGGACTPDEVKAAIVAGCLEFDDALSSSSRIRKDHSGCTLCGVLLSPTMMFQVNCGDSRSLIVRRRKILSSSNDHKPTVPSERRRIIAGGGRVVNQRVNGNLAVSRGLGDFDFKHNTKLAPQDQLVSPLPDVFMFPRDARDEYIVIACDGVFDVLRDFEVVDAVTTQVKTGETDMGHIAKHLVQTSFDRGSRDNISCMVVRMPGAPVPPIHLQEALAMVKSSRSPHVARGGGAPLHARGGRRGGDGDAGDDFIRHK